MKMEPFHECDWCPLKRDPMAETFLLPEGHIGKIAVYELESVSSTTDTKSVGALILTSSTSRTVRNFCSS